MFRIRRRLFALKANRDWLFWDRRDKDA